MQENHSRVCPLEKAGSLNHRFRRLLQNPRKILTPFIKEGMTVLDFGCGPGYFSLEMARLVGDGGKVIAADLQSGMLDILTEKISSSKMKDRITLLQCRKSGIEINEEVDFVLLFYVLHEIPDKRSLFKELRASLADKGRILVVEPPIHVSKAAFRQSIQIALDSGLHAADGPRVFLSKSILLANCA
jgi:ubiquinone/menaquinone biosynthesis C-methylase UbiE